MRKLLCLAALLGVFAHLALAGSVKEQVLKLVPGDGAHAGWKRREAPHFYEPDALFEHIDGAADGYLQRGCRGCASVDFLPGGKGKDFVTVDIYAMGSAGNAGAIYRKEAVKAKSPGIGAESCAGADSLYFRKGGYYVKLTASSTKPPFPAAMLALARKVAAAIGGKGATAGP